MVNSIILLLYFVLSLWIFFYFFVSILFLSFSFLLDNVHIIKLPHIVCARCLLRLNRCMYFCAVYLYRIVMRYFFCNLQYIKGEKKSRIADNAMHVQRRKKKEMGREEDTCNKLWNRSQAQHLLLRSELKTRFASHMHTMHKQNPSNTKRTEHKRTETEEKNNRL